MSTRILLADDHHLMREGLRSIIEQDLKMRVAGQAADGIEAVALAETLKPDLVIMDVHMPHLNGIDATREIKARDATIRIVALSMHREQQFVSDMFRAGADAYLLKHCVLDELETAIRTVLTGRKYLSADLTNLVIDDYVRHLDADAIAHDDGLTARERQILQLIAEGQSTKDIAVLLHLSVSTVETHRQHLLTKLHAHSIAELTKAAIRMGLTGV
ncbi:MAG: response regulator transcription factor [Bacteroidia bacterium]|nr:response regulator transcription factor [Bacteroidia bacterium]